MTSLEAGKRNESGKPPVPKWKFTYHRVTSPLLSLSLNGSRKGDARLPANYKGKLKAFAAVSIVNSMKRQQEHHQPVSQSSYQSAGAGGQQLTGIKTSERGQKQQTIEKPVVHNAWSRTHLEEEIAKMSSQSSQDAKHQISQSRIRGDTPIPGADAQSKASVPSGSTELPVDWKDVLEKYHAEFHKDARNHHPHPHHHHYHTHHNHHNHNYGTKSENLVRKEEEVELPSLKSKARLSESSRDTIEGVEGGESPFGGATIAASSGTSSILADFQSSSNRYSAEFHRVDEEPEISDSRLIGGEKDSISGSFFQSTNLEENEFNAFKSHRRTPLEYKL